MHAVRAGDAPGEHTVIFGLMGESLELSHRALNRDGFARGAIDAAKFLAGKPPGLYTMADVLASVSQGSGPSVDCRCRCERSAASEPPTRADDRVNHGDLRARLSVRGLRRGRRGADRVGPLPAVRARRGRSRAAASASRAAPPVQSRAGAVHRGAGVPCRSRWRGRSRSRGSTPSSSPRRRRE